MKTATFICGVDGVGKSSFMGVLKELREYKEIKHENEKNDCSAKKA